MRPVEAPPPVTLLLDESSTLEALAIDVAELGGTAVHITMWLARKKPGNNTALLTCVIVGLVAAGIEVEVADARGAGGLEVDDVQEGVAGDGLPGTVAVAHAEEGARRIELYLPNIL